MVDPHERMAPFIEKQDAFIQDWYIKIGWVAAIITFIGVWAYAIFGWNFLLGIVVGWVPALVAGTVAFFAWPLAALVVLFIYFN